MKPQLHAKQERKPQDNFGNTKRGPKPKTVDNGTWKLIQLWHKQRRTQSFMRDELEPYCHDRTSKTLIRICERHSGLPYEEFKAMMELEADSQVKASLFQEATKPIPNMTAVIFYLKNHCGYSDKSELKTTIDGDIKVTTLLELIKQAPQQLANTVIDIGKQLPATPIIDDNSTIDD